MSYTKATFISGFIEPVVSIQKQTINDNDFNKILSSLNALMTIHENITKGNEQVAELWNEIISDTISSVHSASSGFYRLAILALRSVLELACSALYFFDHEIEYRLFQQHDLKADKYVSTLVNEHLFFTTKYIKTFYETIDSEETSENSVSTFLKKIYAELSDVVHGRYKTLTKVNGLEIKYNKQLFKFYEEKFLRTLSIVTVMYILRFNDKKDKEIIELANFSGVIRL
ncbi:hypothetical protein [Brevibacillus brevis]|uniref:hypothetical protein n=1 Tax=Brevibacillus brevis TaxID=1393 RepID=UPI001C8EDA90|nr:hypothetical protein [Brevibacillus brevis]MBY0086541.1 hypothetical protein [Brevibacillus brevis]UKK99765.1 hypothetical protein FO446_21090 [Brevibacillus brevis]